jgi:hypothetical protein
MIEIIETSVLECLLVVATFTGVLFLNNDL